MRTAATLIILTTAVVACGDDWPQWRGPTADGVWRETGVVDKFAGDQVPIVWRAPIGSGYSGPTVYRGRVYVTDRLVDPKQTERVHCFDEQTGKEVWKFEYDCPYRGVGYEAGPRASVVCNEGLAYALGTMGHLHVFDAADGKVVWKRDLNADYDIQMPIWGISASPLIVGRLVLLQIGGKDACLVALDKTTGAEVWKALDDRASYAAPVLIEQAGKPVVVCMTGDNVVGLDPASGTVYWSEPFPPSRMPIGISTPIVDRGRLFVTSFYDGSLMLKLGNSGKPTAEKVWRRKGFDEKHTDALHSIISTPLFLGDHFYGVDSYGELRCLDAETGDRIWEDQKATPFNRWSTIHFVVNGDRVWMFNERGELIIAQLSPSGYEEISRAKLIEPTTEQLRQRGGVCWSHPAFAGRRVFARNDLELVCGDLSAGK